MKEETLETLAARVAEDYGDAIVSSVVDRDELTIEIRRERVTEVCRGLRDHPVFGFDQLIDLCGVDYAEYRKESAEGARPAGGAARRASPGAAGGFIPPEPSSRFAVVYHLLSVRLNRRIRLRAWLDDDLPRVASVVELWSVANWFEREAFDLFGILFEGHPDLRRILTDYGFIGYPFRKDFPLIGRVEVRYDPTQERVVYEPVSIEPRVLVPRMIREEGAHGRDS